MWNKKIDSVLLCFGFQKCQSDHSIYRLKKQKSAEVFLALYVDDLLIFSKEIKEIERVKKFLSQEFEMKDLNRLTYFLGIQVMRAHNKGTFSLGQPKYIGEILKSFNMENCKLVATPLEASSKLCKPPTTRTPKEIDTMKGVPYRELVSSLMYVMVATRPDLSNAVSIISQFMQDSSLEHWVAATRILRYLQGTQDLWLQ